MSNRSLTLLLTSLAIVGTAYGLRRPHIGFKRCVQTNDTTYGWWRTVIDYKQCLRTSASRTDTNVVDVVGEIVPKLPETSAPSSGTTANRLALIQSLQGGLARVLEVVPKPILYAITAVVSGLLFFEMSRFVSVFSVPVLLVLGATQSIKEKLEEIQTSPKTLEVDVLSEEDVGNDTGVVGTQAVVRQSIHENDTDEIQIPSRKKKLREISRRIDDARTAMIDARSAASNLKDRISSHQERLKDLNQDKP